MANDVLLNAPLEFAVTEKSAIGPAGEAETRTISLAANPAPLSRLLEGLLEILELSEIPVIFTGSVTRPSILVSFSTIGYVPAVEPTTGSWNCTAPESSDVCVMAPN